MGRNKRTKGVSGQCLGGSMNLIIRQLKLTIIEILKSSDLPVEIKRLILSEISSEIGKQADEEIIKESKEVKNNG